jgi:hypothetical protein
MDFSIHRHLVGLLGWGISPTQVVYVTPFYYRNEVHKYHTIKAQAKTGGEVMLILNLSNTGRYVASFMIRQFHFRGRNPRYTFSRKLFGSTAGLNAAARKLPGSFPIYP